MPLIEGIGDEVLHFVVMTLLIGMTLVAWMSTNARPNRYRTLLVMRSHTPHPVTVSIRSGVPNILYTNTDARGPADTVTLSTSPEPANNLIESGPIIPLQEMDSIVDADMALIENSRLHFYRRVERPNSTEELSEEREIQEDVEPASNAQIQEMDSIVNAMEADLATDARSQESPSSISPVVERVNVPEVKEEQPPEEGAAAAAPADSAEPTQEVAQHDQERKKILIKLKYLNDTLKEVEGSLDESLKDFKWRVFARELGGARRVLLIHGGRVLADERASLRQLGLTHRAVVHALVQPARAAAPPAPPAPAAPPPAPHHRLWDLENVLMTLVSVALTVVWFFRCEYSNMFTASASVALFGLTVFYSVAIFGLYLSDTFHIDRRPQPVPNN